MIIMCPLCNSYCNRRYLIPGSEKNRGVLLCGFHLEQDKKIGDAQVSIECRTHPSSYEESSLDQVPRLLPMNTLMILACTAVPGTRYSATRATAASLSYLESVFGHCRLPGKRGGTRVTAVVGTYLV